MTLSRQGTIVHAIASLTNQPENGGLLTNLTANALEAFLEVALQATQPLSVPEHTWTYMSDYPAIIAGRCEVAWRRLRKLAQTPAMQRPLDKRVDFGLCAIDAHTLLPSNTPMTLEEARREVGFFAHIMERVAAGQDVCAKALNPFAGITIEPLIEARIGTVIGVIQARLEAIPALRDDLALTHAGQRMLAWTALALVAAVLDPPPPPAKPPT